MTVSMAVDRAPNNIHSRLRFRLFATILMVTLSSTMFDASNSAQRLSLVP